MAHGKLAIDGEPLMMVDWQLDLSLIFSSYPFDSDHYMVGVVVSLIVKQNRTSSSSTTAQY